MPHNIYCFVLFKNYFITKVNPQFFYFVLVWIPKLENLRFNFLNNDLVVIGGKNYGIIRNCSSYKKAQLSSSPMHSSQDFYTAIMLLTQTFNNNLSKINRKKLKKKRRQ